MLRGKTTAALLGAIAVSAVLLTACGSDAASTSPSSAAPAASTAASTAASSASSADPSANKVVYTDAVFTTMSEAAIKPNCNAPTPYLAATYSATDYSCTLTLDKAAMFDEVCASDDTTLSFTKDVAAGTCAITSKNAAAVKTGCDAVKADETISATLDEATGTCLLKINPETIITRACDPKAVAPLNASVDAASLSCTLSLTAPVVYQIIAEAEISGDIVCTDGSPKGQPSEPCVLEALKKVSAGQ